MKTVLTLLLIGFIFIAIRLFSEVAIYEFKRWRIRKRHRETEMDKKRRVKIYG